MQSSTVQVYDRALERTLEFPIERVLVLGTHTTLRDMQSNYNWGLKNSTPDYLIVEQPPKTPPGMPRPPHILLCKRPLRTLQEEIIHSVSQAGYSEGILTRTPINNVFIRVGSFSRDNDGCETDIYFEEPPKKAEVPHVSPSKTNTRDSAIGELPLVGE